jgi:plastocyanin
MRACLPAALCGCLVIAACGGSPAPAPTAAPKAQATAVQVEMRHNRFMPHAVVVRLGQAVRWTNRDAVVHTVASQDLRLSSEGIRPGTTFTYRPSRAGTFAYFCTIHFGQTGRLVVR